jgi:hypothetical protein
MNAATPGKSQRGSKRSFILPQIKWRSFVRVIPNTSRRMCSWACDHYLWNSKLWSRLSAACKWRSKAVIFGHFAHWRSEKVTHFDMKMGLKTARQLHPRAAKTVIWPAGPCYYSSAQRARNDAILRSARKWSAARVRIPCDHLDQNLIESLQQPWHLHNQCARLSGEVKLDTRSNREGTNPEQFFPAPRGANWQFCFIPRWARRLSPLRRVTPQRRWDRICGDESATQKGICFHNSQASDRLHVLIPAAAQPFSPLHGGWVCVCVCERAPPFTGRFWDERQVNSLRVTRRSSISSCDMRRERLWESCL